MGLGLLGYLFFREKEETTVDKEFTIVEDSKPNKAEEPAIIKKEVSIIKMQPIIPEEKVKKAINIKPKVLTEPNDVFPLKLGSKGVRVYQLQVYLLKNHGTSGLVTNEFDNVTKERVLRFLKVKEVSEQLFQELNMSNPKRKTKNARKKKH